MSSGTSRQRRLRAPPLLREAVTIPTNPKSFGSKSRVNTMRELPRRKRLAAFGTEPCCKATPVSSCASKDELQIGLCRPYPPCHRISLRTDATAEHCYPQRISPWHAALSDVGLTLAGVDFEEKKC